MQKIMTVGQGVFDCNRKIDRQTDKMLSALPKTETMLRSGNKWNKTSVLYAWVCSLILSIFCTPSFRISPEIWKSHSIITAELVIGYYSKLLLNNKKAMITLKFQVQTWLGRLGCKKCSYCFLIRMALLLYDDLICRKIKNSGLTTK